jgi:hypothetical protein
MGSPRGQYRDVDTEEEEEGAVTVLKLSNGVVLRVPVEVQGMQLPAVVEVYYH